MVMNDTLAAALAKISQYEKQGKQESIISPASKSIANVLGIMKEFGYIKGYERIKEGKKEHFKIKLMGKINAAGVIKPRYSVRKDEFEKYEKRYLPSRDMGIMIVSTVEGMVAHDKAKEKKIGGKLIAYCY